MRDWSVNRGMDKFNILINNLHQILNFIKFKNIISNKIFLQILQLGKRF